MTTYLSPTAGTVEAYAALHRAVGAAIARREAFVAFVRAARPWESIPGAEALQARLEAAELEWSRQYTLAGQGYCLVDVPRQACHQLRLALLDAQSLAEHGRRCWREGSCWLGATWPYPYDGEMEETFQATDLD